MKHTIKLILLFVSSFLLVNCNKPTKDLGLSINGNVIKYGVSLQFWDPKSPNGAMPPNIFVKITGKDASKIYEYGGTKVFNISTTGLLSLGLDPFVKPTSSAPISFTVEVFAPDYLTAKIPVKIDGSQSQQSIAVTLINLKNPPSGVSIKQTEISLASDGSVPTTVSFSTIPTASTPEISTITIPAGTKFKNASGSVINSNYGTLFVTQAYFGTRTSSSLSAFPQNSFVSDSIYNESGARTSGYFQTAGFTSIEMEVAGQVGARQEVKYFTSDVTINMNLDATLKNPKTNVAVVDGDIVPIYSYDVTKNRWFFEKNVTLTNLGGNLNASFTTNHLTYYSPSWTGSLCASAVNITFNTGVNIATTYLLDIYAKNGDPRQPIVSGLLVTASNNQTIAVSGIPNEDVIIRVYPNNANNSQADFSIRDAAPLGLFDGNACSSGNIIINMPKAQNFPLVTFNIVGKCPGNILVYPTVPTYYRQAGTNAPYTLLGTVVGGQFTTTNLILKNTYDFLWLFKNRELRKTKTIDSSNYSRVMSVTNRFPGDTLVDLFCY